MCVYDRRVLLPREAEQGETRDATVHGVAGQEGRRSSMRESMTPDVRARWAALLPIAGQMSVEELLALPEHRWRYELLAGKLTKRPPSDLLYDMMVHMLVSALRDFARTAGIGGTTIQETGVVISATGEPDTMFVPALAFIRSAQMPIADPVVDEIPSVRLVPEFVVEITAPGQERPALAERAQTWLGAGANVVWVIWPAHRQVDIWRAGRNGQASAGLSSGTTTPEVRICHIHDMLDVEDVLPGFKYPAVYLFV